MKIATVYLLFSAITHCLYAQEQCGTMQHLRFTFNRTPQAELQFEQAKAEFNKAVGDGYYRKQPANGLEVLYIIPIVFHIVLNNPAVVTDVQLRAQLDTLNNNFIGNTYLNKLPAWEKPLAGHSVIRFCLASTDAGGKPTTGIDRVTTHEDTFTCDDKVKHNSTGGAAAWNTDNYLNIWVTLLADSMHGYASFPDNDQPDDQGIVVDYRTLPGSIYMNYNTGKTLTHQAGHYFNLYHTWGDDDVACSGTDYVDDTPNQAGATSGCPTSIQTDHCTSSANGILCQDFMDYTYDDCLLLFTSGQVTRMESALLAYRSSLITRSLRNTPVTKLFYTKLYDILQPAFVVGNNHPAPVTVTENKGRSF